MFLLNILKVESVLNRLRVLFLLSGLSLLGLPAANAASSHSEILGQHFLGVDIHLTVASSEQDFELAHYVEGESLVAVAVAKYADAAVYYLEVNDEGGILVAVDDRKGEVTNLLQAHQIGCEQLNSVVDYQRLLWSVCPQ